MRHKDHEEVARAIASARSDLDAATAPGGALSSMDSGEISRVLAIVTSVVAEEFARNIRGRFNRELFLAACGTLEDVRALEPDAGRRQWNRPIDFADVRIGDCLWVSDPDGQEYTGVVGKVTQTYVVMTKSWSPRSGVEPGDVQIRRSAWKRFEVDLVHPGDMPAANLGPGTGRVQIAGQHGGDQPPPTAEESIAQPATPHPPSQPQGQHPTALTRAFHPLGLAAETSAVPQATAHPTHPQQPGALTQEGTVHMSAATPSRSGPRRQLHRRGNQRPGARREVARTPHDVFV